jgi:hypothetical protein
MPFKIPKPKTKRRSTGKYNVAPVAKRKIGDTVYDSKWEKDYRLILDSLTKAANLKDRVVHITEQVDFPIFINGKKIFSYFLDFQVQYGDGRIEYVDAKGVLTDVYRIKKKAVEAYYGIKITEVKATYKKRVTRKK